jgi:NAD-dependent deacetylase
MKHERIVILTGAGISAESGISTFRDQGGLWEHYRLEDVATPEGFRRNPDTVQAFYNERRRQLQDGVEPNAGHTALARLEQEYPGQVLLVTQNVDDLHERAGSRNLIHMHGDLLQAWCEVCRRASDWREPIDNDSACPACGTTGRLRPNVVWFGEMPQQMDRIQGELAACDLFLAVGTSGNVYPAAGFVELARSAGAHTVELNLEPSEMNSAFHEHRHGPAGEVVPPYVDELLAAS